MNKSEWIDILDKNDLWCHIIDTVVDNIVIIRLPQKQGHNPEFCLTVDNLIACKRDLEKLIND